MALIEERQPANPDWWRAGQAAATAAAQAVSGRARPRKKTHRRLAEKVPLDSAPWWVKRAYYLRTQHVPRLSYRAIADQLGRTERQVYAALNPERKQATDRSYEQRNRPAITARQVAQRRAKAPPCSKCGRPMSDGYVREPCVCLRCRLEKAQSDRQVAKELYLAGWKMADIDKRLERPRGSAGALIAAMRAAGDDIPLRVARGGARPPQGPPCARCQHPLANPLQGADREPVCRQCRLEEADVNAQYAMLLFGLGASYRQIGEAIGKSAASAGRIVSDLRRRGIELPHRHKNANIVG